MQLSINDVVLQKTLSIYLASKPTFLSLIRAKEATLFNGLLPYKLPVLDYGCGDGFFESVATQDKNFKIDVGLEINSVRAKLAKQSKIYRKVTVYDGKKIPFKNNSFSTVMSNSVMEHVRDLESNLQEIYRVTKKGGYFYVSVMVEQYENNLLGVKILGKVYKKWMRIRAYHLNLLTCKQWEDKFRLSGFKIITKKGYLDSRNTKLLDIMQYLSLPEILTQNRFPLISRFFCSIMSILFKDTIYKNLIREEKGKDFSSYFYILEK